MAGFSLQGEKAIKHLVFLIFFFTFLIQVSFGVVNVYGPSISHEGIKAAAKAFTAKTRIPVIIIAGPQSIWQKAALNKAGLIYAFSDTSIERLFEERPARFRVSDIVPIAYMDTVLIVRRGNPKNIRGIESVVDKELPILVSETGGYAKEFPHTVWDDLDLVLEKNTAVAMERFRTDVTLPVWMTWTDILMANPDLGEAVPLERRYQVTRTFSLLVARDADEDTRQFLDFLESEEAHKYFTEFGWYFRENNEGGDLRLTR